jgi:hypothetical protein
MAMSTAVYFETGIRYGFCKQIIIDYYMAFFISHVISTRDAHISPNLGYKANVGNYLSRFIAKFPIKFYFYQVAYQ